jgi:hypothetical protein
MSSPNLLLQIIAQAFHFKINEHPLAKVHLGIMPVFSGDNLDHFLSINA